MLSLLRISGGGVHRPAVLGARVRLLTTIGKSAIASPSEEEETNDSSNNNSNQPPVPDNTTPPPPSPLPTYQRVWKASDNNNTTAPSFELWNQRVRDNPPASVQTLLRDIHSLERRGGRLRQTQLGVLHHDPVRDQQLLTNHYTVPVLASALRDREDVLQQAAVLAERDEWELLRELLSIYHPKYVLQRRAEKDKVVLQLPKCGNEEIKTGTSSASSSSPAVGPGLDAHALEVLRKALTRMPRTVSQAHRRRAGVVIALCSVRGVPCLLLEKRSSALRSHADEVCLPGGMHCEINDPNIVATCLREMREEIQLLPESTIVLGTFRCNWGEVHHLVGIAVTPVVCYLGELPDTLRPNSSEVSCVFTLPLASLLQPDVWVHEYERAPIFLGGPFVIWGLTGYILDRFCQDILLPNVVWNER